MTSMKLQTSLLLTILLIHWAASKSVEPKKFYIKNVQSGLVLWASSVKTGLKTQKNNTMQMWFVDPLTPGKNHIRNVGRSPKVLDSESGNRVGMRAIVYNLKEWSQGKNQRFFINIDGTLSLERKSEEGPTLYLTANLEDPKDPHCVFLPHTGNIDQQFVFEPVP